MVSEAITSAPEQKQGSIGAGSKSGIMIISSLSHILITLALARLLRTLNAGPKLYMLEDIR